MACQVLSASQATQPSPAARHAHAMCAHALAQRGPNLANMRRRIRWCSLWLWLFVYAWLCLAQERDALTIR